MSTTACPNCGHSLFVNELTGEAAPCEYCGTDAAGTRAPDPEHQIRINREKALELGVVLVLILIGLGYYSISRSGPIRQSRAPIAVNAISDLLQSSGFDPQPDSLIFNRTIVTHTRRDTLLQTTVDIVSNSDTQAVETIVFLVSLPAGIAFPPDGIAEAAIQKSFDDMVELSDAMIPNSAEAIARAAATVVRTGNPGLAHNKGVAQTHDGWKVTYIAWREIQEGSADTPLLALIQQRLDIQPDPEFEAFNRALYAAIQDAKDVKLTLLERESENSQP